MARKKHDNLSTMEATDMNKPDKSTEAQTVTLQEPAPIVVETKSEKKKGKKRYSNTFARSFQELEAGMTKSARRVAKAVREALDVYEERREESAAKKRNGALRDMLRNQSKALRQALPIAAEAPADLLDAIADMKVVRRLVKR